MTADATAPVAQVNKVRTPLRHDGRRHRSSGRFTASQSISNSAPACDHLSGQIRQKKGVDWSMLPCYDESRGTHVWADQGCAINTSSANSVLKMMIRIPRFQAWGVGRLSLV